MIFRLKPVCVVGARCRHELAACGHLSDLQQSFPPPIETKLREKKSDTSVVMADCQGERELYLFSRHLSHPWPSQGKAHDNETRIQLDVTNDNVKQSGV